MQKRFNMILMLTFLIVSPIVNGKTIKIAVLDTGFDLISKWPHHKTYQPKKICGTYNAIDKEYNTPIPDDYMHGTGVVSILSKYLNDNNVDYCIFLIKIFTTKLNRKAYLDALKTVEKIHPDVINISIAGYNWIDEECDLIKNLLDKKIIIVAAAGNDSKDLSKIPCYPAMCDPRVYKVMNSKSNGELYKSSNYSSKPINRLVKELGTNIKVLYPDNKIGIVTGTSFSAPLFCAKLVEKMFKITKEKNE